MLQCHRKPFQGIIEQAVCNTLYRVSRKIPDISARQSFVFAEPTNLCLQARKLEWSWIHLDQLVEGHQSPLSGRHIPYKFLNGNLQHSNLLLGNCTCPWFAQVACVTKIPQGWSLRIPDILINVVLGRFPPFVGLIGAKTRRKRTPKQANGARKVCELPQPPFPRLARTKPTNQGETSPKALPLHSAGRASTDKAKHRTEAIISLTLIGLGPCMGVDKVQCLLGNCNLGFHKPIAQHASEFETSRRCMYNASQILHIYVQACPILHPTDFPKRPFQSTKNLV